MVTLEFSHVLYSSPICGSHNNLLTSRSTNLMRGAEQRKGELDSRREQYDAVSCLGNEHAHLVILPQQLIRCAKRIALYAHRIILATSPR
jgi:hypothetical protein